MMILVSGTMTILGRFGTDYQGRMNNMDYIGVKKWST